MDNTYTQEYSKIIKLIEKAENILVTCHTRPDGDSCGCVAAFCYALEDMGKKAVPFLISPFADWLGFILEDFKPVIPQDDEDVSCFIDTRLPKIDLVILLDTNSRNQIPGLDKWVSSSKCPVVVFDHHITNDGLGTVEVMDTQAASAGQVVCSFFESCGINITPKIAKSLFISLSSDTGWFRFGNRNRGDVYSMAARLIEKGAEPSEIYNKLFNQSTFERAKLISRMLDSLEPYFLGKVAVGVITQDDFTKTGTRGRDTDSLIQEMQKIGSVVVSVLLIEQADGKFKCSMRSKGGVNVRVIAQVFGGGGHDFAAGATLNMNLQEAKDVVLKQIEKQIVEMGS